MRIIHQGKKPIPLSWREYEWRCNACRTVVEWDGESDVGVHNIHVGDPHLILGTTGYLQAHCPVCEYETTWWRERPLRKEATA